MAPLILYSTDISPPCRSVLLTAAAAGIDLDVKETSLMSGDNRTEEFIKMNPQHTVPTLNDDGFILSDSHAIITYLVDKYAKDDSLYPKDLQQRALVNQYLHFNNSVVFSHLKGICFPLFFRGATTVAQDRLEYLIAACGFLEKYLGDNEWLVGDSYTLADIGLVSTMSGVSAITPLDDFPKLRAWLKRCEDQIPGYETTNAPGNALLRSSIEKILSSL